MVAAAALWWGGIHVGAELSSFELRGRCRTIKSCICRHAPFIVSLPAVDEHVMSGDTHRIEDLHTLTNNLPCAVFRTKAHSECADWALAYISNPIQAITGYAPESLLRDPLDYTRLIYPDDLAAVQARRCDGLRDQQAYSVEYRLIDANHVTRWVWEKAQPSAGGCLDGIIVDVSERKKAEEDLLESDKRFRAFVESTESIVLYLCPEGQIIEFNPAAEALYGKTRQEVLGKNYFKFFLPEEAHEAVMADMRKVLTGTPTRGFENDVITAAGERRVLAWYVTRTLDREGRPTGIVASGHDITERKLAEEALFSSQKMLRLVLDSIPVRVYWKDQNLKYLGCNSLFAKDVGLSRPEDIVGKSDEELGWLEWKEMHEACDRNIMETGVPKLHFETPILSRGDGELWLSISKLPLTRLTELSLTLSGDPDEVFQNAARMIGELLNVRIVCLSEVRDREIHFVSIYADGKVTVDAGSRVLADTPCSAVASSRVVTIFTDVAERFPAAEFLKDYGASFYCGFPAMGSDGEVAAITCLLDSKSHNFSEEDLGLLRIFGQRIAVEIERRRYLDEQARAKEQMKKLSSAVEQTADVVVITDREGIIEYVNPAFEAVTGYSYQEVKGKSSNEIKSSKHDKKFYKRLWATIVRGDVFQDVIINRKKSGELYYEEKTITPL